MDRKPELVCLLIFLVLVFIPPSHLSTDESFDTSFEDSDSNAPSPIPAVNHGLNITALQWIPQKFNITCCNGGEPEIQEHSYAKNLNVTLSIEYVTDEQSRVLTSRPPGAAMNCQSFSGKFLMSSTRFFIDPLPQDHYIGCRCPNMEHADIDRQCKILPECLHNGHRPVPGVRQCKCQWPFFGDLCEKTCDQGKPVSKADGSNLCKCLPLYDGEECRQIICLHGGRADRDRCICPPQFLGYHCEIDTNKTGGMSTGAGGRFQRFGDQSGEMFTRDVSGTIFSLIMIVVLVVSMYLLMKHRMQVQSRYLHRRPDLLSACNFPTSPSSGPTCISRRTELRPPDDLRVYPFRSMVGSIAAYDGPPPYLPPGQRTRRLRNEVLPPLPSYEDATKMPPLRHHLPTDSDVGIVEDLDSEVVTLDESGAGTAADVVVESRPSSERQNLQPTSSIVGVPASSSGGRPCSLAYDEESQAAIVHPSSARVPSPAPGRNVAEYSRTSSATSEYFQRESTVRRSL